MISIVIVCSIRNTMLSCTLRMDYPHFAFDGVYTSATTGQAGFPTAHEEKQDNGQREECERDRIHVMRLSIHM